MEWTDLKTLDTRIQQMRRSGARVEEIGVSGEGRSLYGVTIGPELATHTVVIVAGMHASEVIGPLTAMFILQTLIDYPVPNVQFCVVPMADPDCVARNANELSTTVTLQALLRLTHHRDLEGYFTTDLYPECIAIRQWLSRFNRIDAYFSLHSAHCISPGLFFYVGDQSDLDGVSAVAHQLAAEIPSWISLLLQDPTGLSHRNLAPGFFELDLSMREHAESEHGKNEPAKSEQAQTARAGSSLMFVTQQFQPYYVGASEMPLAVCADLAGASLAEIDQCNREVKQTGQTQYSFQEISLETQLHIMKTWIWLVCTQLSRSPVQKQR